MIRIKNYSRQMPRGLRRVDSKTLPRADVSLRESGARIARTTVCKSRALKALLVGSNLIPIYSGRYLEHLRRRASGEVMTTAAWLRRFVTTHPAYKRDSVVNEEIAYDLVVACQEIGLVRALSASLILPVQDCENREG